MSKDCGNLGWCETPGRCSRHDPPKPRKRLSAEDAIRKIRVATLRAIANPNIHAVDDANVQQNLNQILLLLEVTDERIEDATPPPGGELSLADLAMAGWTP